MICKRNRKIALVALALTVAFAVQLTPPPRTNASDQHRLAVDHSGSRL